MPTEGQGDQPQAGPVPVLDVEDLARAVVIAERLAQWLEPLRQRHLQAQRRLAFDVALLVAFPHLLDTRSEERLQGVDVGEGELAGVGTPM
ncbi:hypothetical protein [Streptomyces sp. AN091965]|uniref:hypothetical protein n=1 Tax=Streptomyces sp. AN091965 TaxID=2927803 RepID=UPI001F624411|nr:hypothetical protein [Streptomyces sp. AN091965]MCI3927858.1 hypothetical protein [Streptomyces sp. AN091965]